MSVEHTYHCDAPNCHTTGTTAWITMRDHNGTDRHFCTWTCVQAVFAGIVIVAGTGNAPGLELLRLIVAPPAGAADVSCTATQVVSPL